MNPTQPAQRPTPLTEAAWQKALQQITPRKFDILEHIAVAAEMKMHSMDMERRNAELVTVLQQCAEQPCLFYATSSCRQSDKCITEYCAHCSAALALAQPATTEGNVQ